MDKNGNTKPIIEKLSTKKGNTERIYRNTMLFLVCSEIGIGKLNSDVREYLSCQKISLEYNSQLEKDQKDEIKRRLDEASRLSESSIVNAYSIVVKYSVKNGVEKLLIKQFRDSIDTQINNILIPLLKEEEWLLDSVGLNTLVKNNMLPTVEKAVKVKDIYEAFLRFDDKPMITGSEAVSTSLLRYCFNGEFCIAAGDGTSFTRYYLKESVPFFEVTDTSYWLVDKSLKPIPKIETTPTTDGSGVHTPIPSQVNDQEVPIIPGSGNDSIKKFKSVKISGKVPLERYTELFNYFITPFAMSGNKIDIEVSFRINSNTGSPIDETKPQYKSAKEAAKQLKLDFEEEM